MRSISIKMLPYISVVLLLSVPCIAHPLPFTNWDTATTETTHYLIQEESPEIAALESACMHPFARIKQIPSWSAPNRNTSTLTNKTTSPEDWRSPFSKDSPIDSLKAAIREGWIAATSTGLAQWARLIL